jgi:hypothetical protein
MTGNRVSKRRNNCGQEERWRRSKKLTKRLKSTVYHCVTQRDGSSEILAWSQYRSLDAAVRFAEKQLKHLSALQSKSA